LGNPVVVFQEVTKEYARGVRALEGISFEVEEGEFFCLIGPSGCGKTTLLKMVNRLLEPTSGRIFVYGQDVRTWDPIALRRSIGYVIQQIGLFPHLTVEENMTYVLAIMGVPLKVRRQRARELLGVIGLDESYLRRFPGELSGGERQRVGVARALAADPKLIVMDEPFGALDEITRMKLQDELLELHRKLKKTILFVTHDLEEALKLSTRLGVMRGGRMLGVGRPYELLLAPPDPFVEEFLGRGGHRSGTPGDPGWGCASPENPGTPRYLSFCIRFCVFGGRPAPDDSCSK
jgi:osmoprotectant transport system ATP-binding protein